MITEKKKSLKPDQDSLYWISVTREKLKTIEQQLKKEKYDKKEIRFECLKLKECVKAILDNLDRGEQK